MVGDRIYFFNFLLNPASPANPEARRSMVAGSGTGKRVLSPIKATDSP